MIDFNSLLSEIDFSTANLVGAALLLILSYLANGQLNRSADRRKAKVRFVEEQLKSLYGPLYAISVSNEGIYQRFYEENPDLVKRVLASEPLTSTEEVVRQTWNAAVFQPSNRRMRSIIEQNAHLFTTETMPTVVSEFLAHVENWEAILHENKPVGTEPLKELIAFPAGFPEYVKEQYQVVSRRHAALIGHSRRS